jgi:hypothetical protein
VIIVTKRTALDHKIKHAWETLWGVGHGRPYVHVRSLGEVEQLETRVPGYVEKGRHQVLVCDLEACGPDAATQLSNFHRLHPGPHIVLIAGAVREQVLLLDAIKTALPLVTSTFYISDIAQQERWRAVFRKGMIVSCGSDLQNALLKEVVDQGHVFQAQDLVFEILRVTPQATQVQDLSRLLGRDRKVLWRELKQAGQLPPLQLLTLFQVLYIAHLRTLAWRHESIAFFLGLSSAKEMHRQIKRRTGISVKDACARSMGELIRWGATTLVNQSARQLKQATALVRPGGSS